MTMVDADWTITRSSGDVRYIGNDHGVGTLVTTGAFVVGTYYRITNVGDTDFTLIGAASNTSLSFTDGYKTSRMMKSHLATTSMTSRT